MPADCEGINRLQEREELVSHAWRGLGPILSWNAEARRQECGIKQKQVAHAAVSSCLVSIISLTQRMACQQKSVGSGIIHTLPTP